MKTCKLFVLASLLLAAACTPKDFCFVHMSDPQIGFRDTTTGYRQSDSLFNLAVDKANALDPALVVITGDLVNKPAISLQDSIYRACAARIKAPLWVIPGNHDVKGETIDEYVARRGYKRFSFTHEGCAFIGIDTNCIKEDNKEAEEEQLAWLKEQLSSAAKCRYKFIFIHCPIFLESADEPDEYFNFPTDKRMFYLNLFKDAGVSDVFAGHTHMDYTGEWEGIGFYTAGPVGSPLGRGYSGYNEVYVGKDGVKVTYVAL